MDLYTGLFIFGGLIIFIGLVILVYHIYSVKKEARLYDEAASRCPYLNNKL